jgi:hypothetical protein
MADIAARKAQREKLTNAVDVEINVEVSQGGS